MIKLEEAKPIEINQIIKITKDSFHFNNWSKSYFEKIYLKNPKGFIVAKNNNEIVGYLIFNFLRNNSVKIISIAVTPLYQRQGIGKALLNYLIKKSKKKKVDKIILNVRIKNRKAINFYQKLNFKIVKKIESYYSNGDNAYLIEKLI